MIRPVLSLLLLLNLMACAPLGEVQHADRPTGAPLSSPPSAPSVLEMLGKADMEYVKKNLPGGNEQALTPNPGSRLATVGAVTSYTAPSGQSLYYFNRQGIMVSIAAKSIRPLSKDQLLQEIKGLSFTKFPPNQVEAAFVRRSATIIQGFYLAQDGKFVEVTTYDYAPQ